MLQNEGDKPFSPERSVRPLSNLVMALQKYLHELHAHMDPAKCNIQSRTILVVQLTLLQKLSTKNL
jgi:hypothetical protein